MLVKSHPTVAIQSPCGWMSRGGVPNELMSGNALRNLETQSSEVSMSPNLDPIPLPPSDLTRKPELYIPESLVAGKPVTLTCAIRGPCIETKVLFLSWKGPTMSFNTDGSSNSSSSVLQFTPKPEDRDTTHQCRLNSLPSLTRSNNSFLVICECWWARGDLESGRNDKPERKT